MANRKSVGQVVNSIQAKDQNQVAWRVRFEREQRQEQPAMPSYLRTDFYPYVEEVLRQARENEQLLKMGQKLSSFKLPEFGVELKVWKPEDLGFRGDYEVAVEVVSQGGISFLLPMKQDKESPFHRLKITAVEWRQSRKGYRYPVLRWWYSNNPKGTVKCSCGTEFEVTVGWTRKCPKCEKEVTVRLSFETEGLASFEKEEVVSRSFDRLIRIKKEVIVLALAAAHYGRGLDMFGLLDDHSPTPDDDGNGGGGGGVTPPEEPSNDAPVSGGDDSVSPDSSEEFPTEEQLCDICRKNWVDVPIEVCPRCGNDYLDDRCGAWECDYCHHTWPRDLVVCSECEETRQ